MKDKKVKDVMIPDEKYATIGNDASLLDMILVLEESNRNVPEDHHKHRAVLVTDEKGKIIGKLGHLGFLKALEPKYHEMVDFDKLSNAGLSSEFVESMMENLSLWNDLFFDLGRQAKKIRVGEVMHPISESIDENASLLEALHKMIMWQALSIPVTKGANVVGLIRQADLYREITSYIKQLCNSID